MVLIKETLRDSSHNGYNQSHFEVMRKSYLFFISSCTPTFVRKLTKIASITENDIITHIHINVAYMSIYIYHVPFSHMRQAVEYRLLICEPLTN